MNRRLLVFSVVFLLASVAGLIYTYSIPPTYVATATIQVDPGTGPDQKSAASVANEAQALSSNEMLESVLSTLMQRREASLGFRSVAQLRETLLATHSPGTNVIELRAQGREPAELAELLDIWANVYLASRGVRRTATRDISIEDARSGVDSLQKRVERKRRQLDEFRRRHNIVSPEREENEVASQIKSLTTTLNEARSKALDTESKLSTVKASIADGKPVYRPQDKATIAQLEQRAMDLRQRLKDLALRFTPDYLAIDPSVKTTRANIAQLEQQIEQTQQRSQQAMLNEAEQEVVTARTNVATLEAQYGERRRGALDFTSRFAEHKAQTAELTQLETQFAQANQRLASFDQTERTREARYELLGRPAVPEKPAHPSYTLYAAYSVGGALLAAVLAVILIDFLTRKPKRDDLAYSRPIIQIAYPSLGDAVHERLRLTDSGSALQERRPALADLTPALRELTAGDVHALWRAATSDGRIALAALFSGVMLQELAALKWDAIDFERGTLTFTEPAHGLRPLTQPLAGELHSRRAGRLTDAVAVTATGEILSVADLEGLVAAAAHDSGIEGAASIDAENLRHTYICYLVRQGVRLLELAQLVGPVAPASFLHYRTLSPCAQGPLSEAQRVYPAFAAGVSRADPA